MGLDYTTGPSTGDRRDGDQEIGGIFSVPVVRLIGALFMGLWVLAILTPPDWGNLWLALGFGGLQIGFGVYIARNHGG